MNFNCPHCNQKINFTVETENTSKLPHDEKQRLNKIIAEEKYKNRELRREIENLKNNK